MLWLVRQLEDVVLKGLHAKYTNRTSITAETFIQAFQNLVFLCTLATPQLLRPISVPRTLVQRISQIHRVHPMCNTLTPQKSVAHWVHCCTLGTLPRKNEIFCRLSVYYILGGRITFLKSLFLPLVDTNLWKTFRPNGLMVNLFLVVEKATGIKVDFLDQKEKLQSLEEESVGIGKRSCMHTMQELLVSSSLTSKLSMCQRLAANLAPVIRKIHWTASDWSSPTTKYQTFWSSIFLVFQKKT